MSLDISVIEPQAVYRPGDQIAGTLTFTSSSKPIPAQQVLISLKHISKCRFGLAELETLYSANVCLNEQTIDLLEAPTALSTSQEWTFKFIIPDSTGYYMTPFQEPSRLYNDDPDQILPPSFNPLKSQTSGSQERVKITLGLHAEIVSEKVLSNVFKREAISTSLLLDFLPPRKAYLVDWEMTTKQVNFVAKSPLLAEVNGHRDRSLSIKEKMLTTIKSNSLPSASFDVLMSLPRVAVVGQPVPLFIGVHHEQAKNHAQENPVVSLKSLAVKLEALTGIRGLSESKSLFRAEHLPASHSSWTKTTELGRLTSSIELTDITDLREHLHFRIPDDTIQSFSTFNIARTYSLSISAVLECAKQKFNLNFDLGPVKLLAAHDQDKENPPGVLQSISANGDALPTWEESGGYGEHGIPGEKEEFPPQYA